MTNCHSISPLFQCTTSTSLCALLHTPDGFFSFHYYTVGIIIIGIYWNYLLESLDYYISGIVKPIQTQQYRKQNIKTGNIINLDVHLAT